MDQETLSFALTQIIAQEPLPLMCMRTLMQAIVYWPRITEFVMELLKTLIMKKVWLQPRLWAGCFH